MQLSRCSKEQFNAAKTDDPLDKFAKTFAFKASIQNLWGFCMGAWDGQDLMGAMIIKVSHGLPKVANLHLIHTFAAHRSKGVGKRLLDYAKRYAYHGGAKYFRVSSEPSAVKFYERCGLQFWGKQKGGCSLCMYRLEDGVYDATDPVIDKALFSGRKGSLAVSWKKT